MPEREEIQKIISNVNLSTLAKECLSIVSSSSLKNHEIEMFIGAGMLDMIRQGIDVINNMENFLIQGAIMMFVKANFGMVDINEKKLAQETYMMLCGNLSLSAEFKIKEV